MLYTSFDTVLCMIQSCSVGAELAKCDIKSVLHLLPVHPKHFELLGFAFEGAFFMDRALSMSCSVSWTAFQHFQLLLGLETLAQDGFKELRPLFR